MPAERPVATWQGNAWMSRPRLPAPTLMPLDPCNLAIDRAQWVTSDGAPAVLGMSSDGRLQVLAERGGQMKFDWSLAGQPDAAGGRFLHDRLAAQPLEPPADRVACRADADSRSRHFDRRRARRNGRFAAGRSSWAAGRAAACGLPRTASNQRGGKLSWPGNRPLTISRSAAWKRLVKLDIDAHRDPLQKIAFDVEPPLEMLEAAAGEQPLVWNVVPHRERQAAASRRRAAAAAARRAVKLQLRAAAPIPASEPWKLPRAAR